MAASLRAKSALLLFVASLLLVLLAALLVSATENKPKPLPGDDIVHDFIDAYGWPDEDPTEGEGEDDEEGEGDEEAGHHAADSKHDSIAEDTNIPSLTHENFESEIAKYKRAIVEFYAPWCPHCKMLKPIYEQVLIDLQDEKDLLVAKINADDPKTSGISSDYGVRGFPTLLFFKDNGKLKFELKGPRTVDGIKNFIAEMSGPSFVEIKNEEDFKRLSERNLKLKGGSSHEEDEDEGEEDEDEDEPKKTQQSASGKTPDHTIILGAFPSQSSPEYKTFVAVSDRGQGERLFGIVTDSKLQKKFDLKSDKPSVVAVKLPSGHVSKYKGSLVNEDELDAWTKLHNQPLIIPHSKVDGASLAPHSPPIFIYYFDRNLVLEDHKDDEEFDLDAQLAIIESTLQKIAEPLVGTLRFSIVDLTRDRRTKQNLVLPDPDSPDGIAIWNRLSAARYHPEEPPPSFFFASPKEQRDEASSIKDFVKDFIDEFKASKLAPVMFSLPSGTKSLFANHPHNSYVTHLVAKDWSQFMASPDPVLLFVFLPGCPYCHEFAPEFRKVAAFWSQDKRVHKVLFAEFNFQDNDFPAHISNPSLVINEFPTLLFFPPSNFEIRGNIHNRTHPFVVTADLQGVDVVQDLAFIFLKFDPEKDEDEDRQISLDSPHIL